MSAPEQVDITPLLDAEISRFETARVAWLHFRPEVEARYTSDTTTSHARTLLTHGLFAGIVYNFFLVSDYFMAPEYILRDAVVRLGVFTPIMLLAAALVHFHKSSVVRELSVAFACLTGSLCILYLHRDITPLVSMEAQVGLMLMLLGMNCLIRLEPIYAATTTLLVMIADVAWLYSDASLSAAHKLVLSGMMVWAVLLTLAANYAIARERRFSYLLQLHGRLQRSKLADANAELIALSSTDRLTGLPNRRAYDLQLPKVWTMAKESRTPLSAVMVDVDHFKRVNDTYGHPYGDRVLQRVASLLLQALREEDDFVGRFGGEEFVVLLPHTNSESAIKVAERIRTLVQVAGSPALQRDTMLHHDTWTTVSCGVATMYPSAAESDPARLIADADAAMYQAKREGRNRVCCASSSPAPGRLTVLPRGA
ncbi:MAG: GGDEF domain-containing protein [Terriglobus sp.]